MTAGDVFGPYRIVRRLGRGAMGDVYLALRPLPSGRGSGPELSRDREGAVEVALKVVFGSADPEDAEILAAECVGAELQQQLAAIDPRVVKVHGNAIIDGHLAIEMEYVDGEDLSGVLARGPLPVERAAEIGIELCQMLANLAQFATTVEGREFVGVVHGDLKPRNIRINTRNELKVLDFGIAKALSLTRKYTSNIFASAAYCSPERLDTQTIDMRSDLWSVGVLLYQMTAGRLPFDAPNRERLERRIRSYDPPDPMPPEVPAPLRDIVFQMLARDPAERYAGAMEVTEDLWRFLRGAPVAARPAPVPVASGYDSDATVRTSEATVRTSPAELDPPDDATVRTTVPTQRGPLTVRVRGSRSRLATGCFIVFAVAAVAVAGLTAQQVSLWNAAGSLKHDLDTEHVSDLETAWQRYQKLDSRLHLPLSLWGVRRSLKSRLIAAGDEVIAEYRSSENPTVRSTQWKQARSYFDHALEIDPGDNGVRGRIRLCEGHLERIEAGRGPTRVKRLNTAVAKFTEAAQMLKRSPDPYLGLARLYTYELNDMDRAEQALNKAAEYGHPAGNREKAQLADGYRRRAEREYRDSRSFPDLPGQEKEYLDMAKQDYLKAQDLYQQLGVWGEAPRARAQTLAGFERVEQRLWQLQGGPPPQ